MTEEEQIRIFAKNLNYYIANSGKAQKEVAEAIGFSPTTFNTWCTGKILPKTGKIQAIADYFGILKSDLLEDKDIYNKSEEFFKVIAKLADDPVFQRMAIGYYNLDAKRQRIFSDFFEVFIARH